MKAKSILGLFIFLLSMGLVSSCEDMLTPDMDTYQDANGRTLKDTVNNYFGILRSVQQVAEQNTILGEVRGDLVSTTSFTTDSISKLANFENLADGDNDLLNRAAYYYVINQCNFYLRDVDTVSTKNNNYYMRKEAAQVILIRAWAYMQLVQNYGRVPFFVDAVGTATSGYETNPPAWATPDNLLDLLLKDGDLMRAYEYEKQYGFPNYGAINNGRNSISIDAMLFPSEIIIAELYLLRGANTADYETAAKYYYDYLYNRNSIRNMAFNPASWVRLTRDGEDIYNSNVSGYTSAYMNISTYSNTGEIKVLTPSAANKSFGLVLSRIPNLYGFETRSTSNTSSTATTDASTGSVSQENINTSGQVNVSANYKYRQLAPSNSYVSLNENQAYAISDKDNKDLLNFPEQIGDARLVASAPKVRTDEGDLRFVHKFCAGNVSNEGFGSRFSFRYCIPIFRLRQIYLHFAEAINRAGFPHYAFAVLRDGLNHEALPSSISVQVDTSSVDFDKKVVYSAYVVDSVEDGANYIPVEEFNRAQTKEYLDFSASTWTNRGIHELGCGESTDENYVFTYDTLVAQRILDEAARSGSSKAEARRYAKRLLDEDAEESLYDTTGTRDFYRVRTIEIDGGRDTTVIDTITCSILTPKAQPVDAAYMAAQQNAVETLIADEAALETAFEGFRYYDLMRMARHKNNDANLGAGYGTLWMAWLIGRRDADLKPYEEPTVITNSAIYSKLQDMNNWYLASPVFK
ncbi:RagB/SusD family nutrient uptake outer membrane protein [Pseudoprevotella muciniphila]|uniref:RagB/SusD family nutrient uptake outer membrane protein n=1 Tax=Pseudoprevotella muciniphila TaxID=2133944 RepID=A0A5P8E993_9BACT|nr:RagB/SusD family nutrient uptake outer membrane protein [Pseudoprevotella muciniphila]QFQ13514.1 RagB/SusD family nutrient uptake outer membrane protein [Pseudoprevotella muciniphila]